MSTELPATDTVETEKKEKKHRGTGLVILLIIFLILFLLTSIILGSRLYDLATRDQYTVDLGMGEPEGTIELFRIEYSNEKGEVTVQGVNADNVVAPGTTVDYDIRLRNNDDVVIDFMMTPTVEFLTDDAVPVEFTVIDSYGNYILGSETEWITPAEMNELHHKGSIYPGEVFTYHVTWRWVFEIDEDQDSYDTSLGNENGEIFPGVAVLINTDSMANPYLANKDITHLTHLRGNSFGCCWCCYLVWLLLLVVILLLVWIWQLKKKLNKLEKIVSDQEDPVN